MSGSGSPGPAVRAFVQARMSSARFPGKVLAPLAGRPLVTHVVDRARAGLPGGAVTVLTSAEATDDPLACYVAAEGVDVRRGSLDDVVGRFVAALADRPCEWFYRVSADSPLVDPALFPRLAECIGPGVDIVTNVFPRTFPHGLSLELVRTTAFLRLAAEDLDASQREHVTKAFYDEPGRWRIVNVAAGPEEAGGPDVAVDTVDDLARVEAILCKVRA